MDKSINEGWRTILSKKDTKTRDNHTLEKHTSGKYYYAPSDDSKDWKLLGTNHSDAVNQFKQHTQHIPGKIIQNWKTSIDEDTNMNDTTINELSKKLLNRYVKKSNDDLDTSRKVIDATAKITGKSVEDVYDDPRTSGERKRQYKRYRGLDDADYKLRPRGGVKVAATEDVDEDTNMNDTTINEDVATLVAQAIEKNPIDFAATFDSIIRPRAVEALNTRRIELAQSLYTPAEQSVEGTDFNGDSDG